MTENAKYTAGPYTVRSHDGCAKVWGGPVFICNTGPVGLGNADAERIRLALTCHDPQLAACKKALRRFSDQNGLIAEKVWNENYEAIKALEAAIALAKEEAK